MKLSYGGQYEAELATGVKGGGGIECWILFDERNSNKLQLTIPIFGVSEHWFMLNDWLKALMTDLRQNFDVFVPSGAR